MIKYFHGYELSLVAKKFRDRTETLYFESLVTIVKIMHQSSPTPPPPSPHRPSGLRCGLKQTAQQRRDSTNDQDGDNPGNFPYVSVSAEPKPQFATKSSKRLCRIDSVCNVIGELSKTKPPGTRNSIADLNLSQICIRYD